MCSWLFHLILIKIYNPEVNLTLLIWHDFAPRQTLRDADWKPSKVRGNAALIRCLSTTSCNLTLPVQHETCEQSSGNWNSCSLPLGSCFRTGSFPTHALGLCYFHNMTSQSVVCPHVSQNYCQVLKIESVHTGSCSVAARTAALNNSPVATVTSEIQCSLDGIFLSSVFSDVVLLTNCLFHTSLFCSVRWRAASYWRLRIQTFQHLQPFEGPEREVEMSEGIRKNSKRVGKTGKSLKK
jgi:hypothetical protein